MGTSGRTLVKRIAQVVEHDDFESWRIKPKGGSPEWGRENANDLLMTALNQALILRDSQLASGSSAPASARTGTAAGCRH